MISFSAYMFSNNMLRYIPAATMLVYLEIFDYKSITKIGHIMLRRRITLIWCSRVVT